MEVAKRLVARGDRVTGIRSDAGRAGQLQALGVEPLVLDLADPQAARGIPSGFDGILAMQSARGEGLEPYRRAYLDANRTLLDVAGRDGIGAFVYTGSTGIFGQRDGSEVDEGTPPAPATASGEVLAEAEAAVRAARGRVLRLSGLYGPGRLWIIDRVARGLMTLGPGDEAWMNACHQEDAALTVIRVLDRGRDGAVYHATDESPMRRREVITFVARRLGITPAISDTGTPGPNRRILGARTRQELGLEACWPSLREGLEPFLSGEGKK